MATIPSSSQRRLGVLVNEAAPSREAQARRDAWTFYQRNKTSWRDSTVQAWSQAVESLPTNVKTDPQDMNALELVGTNVVENRILASRLVLRVMDKVSPSWTTSDCGSGSWKIPKIWNATTYCGRKCWS